ncbi:MAG: hypothetical protein ACT4PW_04040 [Acidimicrobiia bacterium]
MGALVTAALVSACSGGGTDRAVSDGGATTSAPSTAPAAEASSAPGPDAGVVPAPGDPAVPALPPSPTGTRRVPRRRPVPTWWCRAQGCTRPVTGSGDINGSVWAIDFLGTVVIEPVSFAERRVRTPAGLGELQLVLRYLHDEVQLVLVDLTAGSTGRTFRPAVPVPYVPADHSPGTAWSWEAASADGLTTLRLDATVTGTETVTVAGQPVPVTVVRSDITFGGDVVGTGRLVTYYSVERSLAVQLDVVLDVTYALVIRARADVVTRLTTLPSS